MPRDRQPLAGRRRAESRRSGGPLHSPLPGRVGPHPEPCRFARFCATLFVLRDGKTLSGLVLSETSGKIELLMPDATRKTIPASDVEERKLQNVSPMPAGLVKTPQELSDLLAYLLVATK